MYIFSHYFTFNEDKRVRYSIAFNECRKALNGRVMTGSRVRQCRRISYLYAEKRWKSLYRIYYKLSCGGDPYLCRLVEVLGCDIVQKMTEISQIKEVRLFAEANPAAHNFYASTNR